MEERRNSVIDWEKHSNYTNSFLIGLIIGLAMGAFSMWAFTKRNDRLAKLSPACMVKIEKECRKGK
jgi:hypothetical protein